MDMRLFLLSESEENYSFKTLTKILGNLNTFSDENVDYEQFTNLKGLFGGLSSALNKTELIVIAVSNGLYNKTKTKLIKALSLPSENSKAVENKISERDLTEEQINAYSVVPKDSTVLLTDDGLYSGFVVKKGKQKIALIPLDDDRTPYVLTRGLVPYLTNGDTLKVEKETEKDKEEAVKHSIPQKTQTEVREKVDDEKVELALRTLNILKENDIKIAVSGNTNSNMLREIGDELEDFYDYFSFTPHVEDKGDYNVTDYTAQMARSARGLSNADLGACISDIFMSDDCDYICIAVSTDKSALVRKLYKEDDETDEQFVMGAAEELFALISEKTAGNNSVGIEIPQEDILSDEKKKMKKSTKIIIAVICVLLVAAAAVGVLYFVKNKNKPVEPETTTAPTTTQAETTTEAPKAVELKLLSDIIRDEAVNGVKQPEKKESETTTASAISGEEPAPASNLDENGAPIKIKVNGTELDGKEAIARIVESEMPATFDNNAIKAQAVVVFTYLKYRNTDWAIDGVKMVDSASQNVVDCVNEVYGKYLTFNNEVAFTPYFYMSAGETSTPDIILDRSYTYLKTVGCAADRQRENYKLETVISADELNSLITDYDAKVNLGEDASKYLEITEHDTAVNKSTGYVKKIKVGDKEISGMTFVYDVMKSKNLASPCFSISYNTNDNTYTITTFGAGYGVGMSQCAADSFAKQGRTYEKILDIFYSGTVLVNN